MATAFMPMLPPAGSYQQVPYPTYYPQQQQPYSPPQQNFYPQPQYQQQYSQQYPQQYPPQYQSPSQLSQQVQYPPQQYQGRATPVQGWPSHAGEYMGPGYKYNNYTDDDSPDYNNPPEPQYGIPESKRGEKEAQGGDRGDPRFVFPDSNGQNQGPPGPNGERGLGATVLGGGAGAFLGHKMNHGALGTIGGLAIGAIAANAFEHHEKKKKEERRESRAFDDGYRDGEDQPRHHSHSRGLDDDYDDQYYEEDRYEDDEEYRPRHHHHHQRDYDDDYYYQDDDYRDEYYDRRDDY